MSARTEAERVVERARLAAQGARRHQLAELAEIPLPEGPLEWETPEGWTVPVTPEFVRTVAVLDKLFGPIRVVKRRDLRST